MGARRGKGAGVGTRPPSPLGKIKNTVFFLKSLRSVQISILEPKNYPRSLRIDQYCEKILGMSVTKSF